MIDIMTMQCETAQIKGDKHGFGNKNGHLERFQNFEKRDYPWDISKCNTKNENDAMYG